MTTFAPETPHPILDELHDALDQVRTILSQKWDASSLSVQPLDTSPGTPSKRSFRVTAASGRSVRVRFSAFPLSDDMYEVYVELEDGPTRRFTYTPSSRNATAHLEREATAFLLDALVPLFDETNDRAPSGPDDGSPIPQLLLDREADIQHMSAAARRMLNYSTDETPEPNFFSFVHRQNLHRVMRDLAHMVSHGMQRAQWLLRLRTGKDRWRWYRATVRNKLRSDDAIQVQLRPLRSAQ